MNLAAGFCDFRGAAHGVQVVGRMSEADLFFDVGAQGSLDPLERSVTVVAKDLVDGANAVCAFGMACAGIVLEGRPDG